MIFICLLTEAAAHELRVLLSGTFAALVCTLPSCSPILTGITLRFTSVNSLTSLELVGGRVGVQQFKHGDYTLMHDDDPTAAIEVWSSIR